MAQSRFLNKSFGSIILNDDQLTTIAGNLLLDNHIVTGSNGVNYTSSGNVFHTFFGGDVTVSGGNLAFFADTTGNLITDADIYLITSTSVTSSYICGGSSGSLLGAPEMPNLIYLGDDSIQLCALSNPNYGNIISINTSYMNVNNSVGISIVANEGQYLYISTGNFGVNTSGDVNCSSITLPVPPNQGFNYNHNVFRWLNLQSDSFTQATSIITNVGTGNYPIGKIYTENITLGNQESTQFYVGHNYVGPNSVVLANIINYTGSYGSNGLPSISVNNLTNGAFYIVIMNNSTTNAMSGNLTIGYQVHVPENET